MSYDNDYPTDAELEALENFEGTPQELVEAIQGMWWGPVPGADYYVGDFEREYYEVRLVTHGWSGNELIMSVLSDSLFHLAFWESIHRGGLWVYRIPKSQWTTHGTWGQI